MDETIILSLYPNYVILVKAYWYPKIFSIFMCSTVVTLKFHFNYVFTKFLYMKGVWSIDFFIRKYKRIIKDISKCKIPYSV